jgi:hypothetical protein
MEEILCYFYKSVLISECENDLLFIMFKMVSENAEM